MGWINGGLWVSAWDTRWHCLLLEVDQSLWDGSEACGICWMDGLGERLVVVKMAQ